jgi:predicted DNA-binding transcriptional regulator AlpA
MNSATPRQLIKGWKALVARECRARQTIWRDICKGKHPAPIELGENSVAWYEDEIAELEASRPRRTYRQAPAAEPDPAAQAAHGGER